MENTETKMDAMDAEGVEDQNGRAEAEVPTLTEIESLKINLDNAKAEAAKNKDGWFFHILQCIPG